MKKIAFTLFLFAVLLASCQSSVPQAGPAEDEIVALVENFGEHLKSVSLLAPDAADQIQSEYAVFVTPDLLQRWVADPTIAPGRVTSSPWPERIEIASIAQQDNDTFFVDAYVIEVTSAEAQGEEAARYPVSLLVKWVGEQWLISEFQQGGYQ